MVTKRILINAKSYPVSRFSILKNNSLMMTKISTSLIFIFITVFAYSQESLSLNEAIAKALENNYSITLVKQNQQMAEINNSWGAAGRYPYVGISLGADNNINQNESADFTQNRFSAGLNLSWTLFDGFSVRINKQRFAELEELFAAITAFSSKF